VNKGKKKKTRASDAPALGIMDSMHYCVTSEQPPPARMGLVGGGGQACLALAWAATKVGKVRGYTEEAIRGMTLEESAILAPVILRSLRPMAWS
jgi:hypothetical protein